MEELGPNVSQAWPGTLSEVTALTFFSVSQEQKEAIHLDHKKYYHVISENKSTPFCTSYKYQRFCSFST